MTDPFNVIHRIHERMTTLSPSQQRIAEFILSNPDDAAFLTAAELAKLTDVSQPTVVRFAMELDLPGYPNLQSALQQILRHKLTAVERFRRAAAETDAKEHILHRVLRQDMANLEQLFSTASTSAFDEVVRAIDQAKRVYVVGVRAVGGLALTLGSYLAWVRPAVYPIVFTAGTMQDDLAHIEPGDVVIGLSFPRYARPTVDALRQAYEGGAITLAITDAPTSPLVPVAKHTLFVPDGGVSFVGSYAAPAALIQALVVAVALQDRRRTQATLERLEAVWGQSKTYALPALLRDQLFLSEEE